MTQGFDFTRPAFKENLESNPVRANFQALSTHHRGSTPPASPQLGFGWIDDSNALNWKFKWYVDDGSGPQWIVLVSHLESTPIVGEIEEIHDALTFLEGANPPPLIDVDTYAFEDAAGFAGNVDQDVIFRLPASPYTINGVKLFVRYFVNTAPATGFIRLRLDYSVVNPGDGPNGSASYATAMSLEVPPGADIIDLAEVFTIPAGNIPSIATWINCRLSRLGTDAADTYDGTFCLMSIHPRINA